MENKHEDRKYEDKSLHRRKIEDEIRNEKRTDDIKWRRRRDAFVSRATRRLGDNIETISVLHGVNYENIVRNLADRLSKSDLTSENANSLEEVFHDLSRERAISLHNLLVALEVDPVMHDDDKAVQSIFWIAATLHKEIEETEPSESIKLIRLRRLYKTYFKDAEKARRVRNAEILRIMNEQQD